MVINWVIQCDVVANWCLYNMELLKTRFLPRFSRNLLTLIMSGSGSLSSAKSICHHIFEVFHLVVLLQFSERKQSLRKKTIRRLTAMMRMMEMLMQNLTDAVFWYELLTEVVMTLLAATAILHIVVPVTSVLCQQRLQQCVLLNCVSVNVFVFYAVSANVWTATVWLQ